MSSEIKNEAKSSFTEIEGIKETIGFFKKYQNYFLIALGAIAVGALAYMFLGKKKDASNMLKAVPKLQSAASYLAQDSLELALKGNSDLEGLEKIIKKNGNNAIGKEARYYAAVAYLRQGNNKKALELLDDAGGFGPHLNAKRLCLMGDAKSQMGVDSTGTVTNKKDAESAISYYKEAADQLPEDGSSGHYLYKAANLAEVLGNIEEAKKLLAKIIDTYIDDTQLQKDAQKMAAKLGVIK
jgi:tetratricopeptide (TPR) repeat protein